jgi:hypothetical protein
METLKTQNNSNTQTIKGESKVLEDKSIHIKLFIYPANDSVDDLMDKRDNEGIKNYQPSSGNQEYNTKLLEFIDKFNKLIEHVSHENKSPFLKLYKQFIEADENFFKYSIDLINETGNPGENNKKKSEENTKRTNLFKQMYILLPEKSKEQREASTLFKNLMDSVSDITKNLRVASRGGKNRRSTKKSKGGKKSKRTYKR